MLTKVFKYLVLVFPIFLPSQAYWWTAKSTEAPPPAPPIMKQIPLTYFRTYTYQQPLPTNQLQMPLLSSTDYITNFGALGSSPYYNPMLSVVPLGMSTNNEITVEAKPEKSYASLNLVRSLGALPAASTTTPEPTTTTTTTTTPVPTTTTTTTPEPTTATPTEASTLSVPLIHSDAIVNMEATYPALKRKIFTNHFNINYNRPAYPYPEYSLYKSNSPKASEENHPSSNVEFVPCMCPVNIQNPAFYANYQPGNPLNSIFLAQSRINNEAEASLDYTVPNNGVYAGTETTNSVNDLQKLKLLNDEATATPTQNNLT